MDGVRSLDDLLQPGAFDESMAEFRTSGTGPLGHPSISVAYIPADHLDTDNESSKAKAGEDAAVNNPVSVAASNTRQITRRALRSSTGCATQSVMIPALHKTPESLDPLPSSVTSDSRRSRFFSINTLLRQPFSRGSVHIASPNVHDLPVYDPRILPHPHDKAILTKHVLQVNKLLATPPFSTQVVKPDGVRYPDLNS